VRVAFSLGALRVGCVRDSVCRRPARAGAECASGLARAKCLHSGRASVALRLSMGVHARCPMDPDKSDRQTGGPVRSHPKIGGRRKPEWRGAQQRHALLPDLGLSQGRTGHPYRASNLRSLLHGSMARKSSQEPSPAAICKRASMAGTILRLPLDGQRRRETGCFAPFKCLRASSPKILSRRST
jgi:hypothetical protein